MGIEKQGSKGGNYVGGFLQMFDWNAKSRKKLFSSKSDVPEQSKQKKRCDGNLPTTRLQMLEMDEITAGSSIKEGSDYSCSSSLIDEDFYGTRAPGVVARLMGLDSLPKSTPLFDSQSLHDSTCYQTQNLDYCQDQIFNSGSLHDLPVRTKVINRPIEKFQTEILPPKSAKSIPITHHKLLSPIKNANFIPKKDAAHIMEAAARIIEPGRQVSSEKMKLPPVGSSSVPLRVVDFKERVKKPLKVFEGSQRKSESSAVKSLRGHSMNKSLDSEEYSVGVKNKGKSISLALQAKVNVQKREGLNVKEQCELSPNNNNLLKSRSTAQKNMLKKTYSQNGSSALRQNNQKQNCIVDRGKLPAKCNSKGAKTSSSKPAGTSKANSRKLGSEVKDDKSKTSSSSSEKVITCKKRSVDGNYYCPEKNQSVKNVKKTIRPGGGITDSKPISWDKDSGKMGTDVVSFTFTAPMTRSGPGSGGPTRFSYLGHNMKGGDALSTLLEQKLKELAQKVEFSEQKLGPVLHEMALEGNKTTDGVNRDNQANEILDIEMEEQEEPSMSESYTSQATKSLDCRLPSPVSVLEHSPFGESCNSSDTADSNSMGDSKQCSSVQAHEVLDAYSSKMMLLTIDRDADLSDSASSNSTNCEKSKTWELEYVKEILCSIEPMFEDYALGRSQGVIKFHLFDQLESQKGYLSNTGDVSRVDKRLVFDCMSECLDLRCGRYVNGGCKLWAKGSSMVKRKERLAEEVYKEISGWSGIADSMIDELVDKDMSGQFGKWVDFDTEAFELGLQIESRILSSLIDEVVADILVL